MTHLQLWRSRVPALLAALLFFGLALPLFFLDAHPASPKMFVYAHSAGLSASCSVLFFVALNLLGVERTQRSLPLLITRPVSSFAYLGGRCLGVLLLHATCFVLVCTMLVVAHLFGVTQVTGSCVAFWLLSLLLSSSQIIVALAAGALFAQGVALFSLTMLFLFVQGFPVFFFGDKHWFFNGLAHLAFYLAPYSGTPRQVLATRLAEPLTLDAVEWMFLSGVDHVLYAMSVLALVGSFFRTRTEQLTDGK